MENLFLTLLFILTWALSVLHLSTHPPLDIKVSEANKPKHQVYFPRTADELHHLVLKGQAFDRGYQASFATAPLMAELEDELMAEFHKFFPNPFLRWGFLIGIMRWFWGVDQYFDPVMIEEIYGASLLATTKYDHIVDRFTRGIAYHGLHEVGQMFVDVEREDFGCTVIALRSNNHFVVGRNFDFEATRAMDLDKILKWHFPDQGIAYVSVIWAGMTGVVTGVNAKGVYVSLNAAGSKEFRRYGTPTTWVVAKALREATSAEDAVRIIQESTVFISDIFVVSDRGAKLFIVEKTPQHSYVRTAEADIAVTNHFLSEELIADPINVYRRDELTSALRLERAKELISSLPSEEKRHSLNIPLKVLSFLRDKKGVGQRPLPLGHRHAIDALIASHGVIYDAEKQTLFVSQGPALVGRFLAYDLKGSFKEEHPVRSGNDLNKDPDVDETDFYALKAMLKTAAKSQTLAHSEKSADCQKAADLLNTVPQQFREHASYYGALGSTQKCLKNPDAARAAWSKALSLSPAYPGERQRLQKELL